MLCIKLGEPKYKTTIMKTSTFLILSLLLALLAQAHASPEAPHSIHQIWLQGRWQMTLPAMDVLQTARAENAAPETNEIAVLEYHFLPDGALKHSIEQGSTRLEETGRWELSTDGQYLLMYFQGKPAEKALIRYIEADEMVLEYALRIPGSQFYFESRQLFFSKV